MINLKFLLMFHSICNSMKNQLISDDEVAYETQNHRYPARCTVLIRLANALSTAQSSITIANISLTRTRISKSQM